MNITKTKLKEMFELQLTLNNATNGEGWEKGKTNKDREINWKRCIYMESAELIDSFNWKHWKDIDAPDDIDNAIIEAVDIWHFLMSEGLTVFAEKPNKIDILVDMCIKEMENYKIDLNNDEYSLIDKNKVIKDAEGLIFSSLFTFPGSVYHFSDLLISFFKLMNSLNLSLDKLYKIYIGKNILNQFRQNNGYLNGTYVKIWKGEEDNVVMQRILDDNDMGVNELYTALELAYLEALKND